MTPLTFEALRKANVARLPHFKNKTRELGEYANLRKKYERGDIAKKEFDVENTTNFLLYGKIINMKYNERRSKI